MYCSTLAKTVNQPTRQHTIMIIDDSDDMRQILGRILRPYYRVLSACNVDVALNILSDLQPDLVITDYEMPGKNGLTGLKEIRRMYPGMHVIMLTGSATRELAQEALRQGADECLAKPFDLDAIRDCVHHHLASHAA